MRDDDLTTSLLEKTSLLTFSNTSTIGFDLMRTMGWREGQGVGPVLRKIKDLPEEQSTADTTIEDNKQIVIHSGSESEGEIVEDETTKDTETKPVSKEYYSAPRDLTGQSLVMKEDKMGLGYTGMRPPTSSMSKYQTNLPFPSGADTDRITSLFGGTLSNPYDVDESDTRSKKTEWYRQEATSDDEDTSFGWSGGGEGLHLSSFEQIGNLCCTIPPCKVKIPPNYTPTAILSNATKNSQIQPYTEQSAAARGRVLGVQSSQPKLPFDSSKLKFNPLLQSLSNRFVPAQMPDSVTDPKTPIAGISDPAAAKQEVKIPQQNKEKMEWHPHRILCKRFNLPDPYPSSGLVGVPYRPEKLTFSSLMLSMGGTSESTGTSEQSADQGGTLPWCPTSSDHLPSSDQRPPVDLFTSVFGGQSSSESEGEGTEDQTNKPVEEGARQVVAEEKPQTESQNSLQVLAQMASKEIEKKKSIEDKKKKRKSKFVEADEMEGDNLPKFSLVKAFGAELPPEMFAPAVLLDESDEDNYKDQRFKRKDRDKDRNYTSRHSSHHDKRYHHYPSSNTHRRK